MFFVMVGSGLLPFLEAEPAPGGQGMAGEIDILCRVVPAEIQPVMVVCADVVLKPAADKAQHPARGASLDGESRIFVGFPAELFEMQGAADGAAVSVEGQVLAAFSALHAGPGHDDMPPEEGAAQGTEEAERGFRCEHVQHLDQEYRLGYPLYLLP